jgi:hypothetical protein
VCEAAAGGLPPATADTATRCGNTPGPVAAAAPRLRVWSRNYRRAATRRMPTWAQSITEPRGPASPTRSASTGCQNSRPSFDGVGITTSSGKGRLIGSNGPHCKPPTRLAGGETVRFATLREALMPSSTRVPAHSCVTAVTPSCRASACGKATPARQPRQCAPLWADAAVMRHALHSDPTTACPWGYAA